MTKTALDNRLAINFISDAERKSSRPEAAFRFCFFLSYCSRALIGQIFLRYHEIYKCVGSWERLDICSR